jgi:hypothetical protein
MGGLSGTVTTAQTVNLDPVALGVSSDRIGAADLTDVQWWLQIYTSLGATAVNATVNVNYTDTTSGNLTVVALGATPRADRLYPLDQLAAAGKVIAKINSVTLSASTLSAGNFGFCCTRVRAVSNPPIANLQLIQDWAQLGLPVIHNDSCLTLNMLCTTTSTGVQTGGGKIIHG